MPSCKDRGGIKRRTSTASWFLRFYVSRFSGGYLSTKCCLYRSTRLESNRKITWHRDRRCAATCNSSVAHDYTRLRTLAVCSRVLLRPRHMDRELMRLRDVAGAVFHRYHSDVHHRKKGSTQPTLIHKCTGITVAS